MPNDDLMTVMMMMMTVLTITEVLWTDTNVMDANGSLRFVLCFLAPK